MSSNDTEREQEPIEGRWSLPIEPFNEEPIEEPIQIDLPRCRHVYGHRCLAEHLYSDTAWSNTCPICREVWYIMEDAESHETLDDEVADLRRLMSLWNSSNALNWALVAHLATQIRDNRYEILMNALDAATVELLLEEMDRWLEEALESRSSEDDDGDDEDGEPDAEGDALDQGGKEQYREEDLWEDDDWRG
ncbi:hypothetical protein K491DRAFT_756050 [Lophiostoma macrostomum CBS 122681]|uniref:Uncharacterized protein n=1 Tax=Lophiostoma macrostomum CBS 122681 TaxID=1314788 RepID=A0A6A6TH43_9PLEO|nr:hypothetical protein K491DRAFT_756050 [Lophiostoma macrostomum CBS 122681]